MNQHIGTNSEAILKPKLKALVDAFLLFKYKHSSPERKQKYEADTRNERIARTMRLEGDNVSADDVGRWLSPKS